MQSSLAFLPRLEHTIYALEHGKGRGFQSGLSTSLAFRGTGKVLIFLLLPAKVPFSLQKYHSKLHVSSNLDAYSHGACFVS